jgi:D-tyrosyl-tRNA(Tyr) deacylase
MKVVLQRVLSASVSVSVEGNITGKIGPGYLLLVGLAAGDDEAIVRRLAADVSKARLMSDAQGKMGVNLRDAGGQALAVSQFTLLADFSKGNRPSFNGAAKPEIAKPLFDLFVQELGQLLGQPVPTGVFGADMRVELVNDGPVTVVLE